jgi:hypothetical protein
LLNNSLNDVITTNVNNADNVNNANNANDSNITQSTSSHSKKQGRNIKKRSASSGGVTATRTAETFDQFKNDTIAVTTDISINNNIKLFDVQATCLISNNMCETMMIQKLEMDEISCSMNEINAVNSTDSVNITNTATISSLKKKEDDKVMEMMEIMEMMKTMKGEGEQEEEEEEAPKLNPCASEFIPRYLVSGQVNTVNANANANINTNHNGNHNTNNRKNQTELPALERIPLSSAFSSAFSLTTSSSSTATTTASTTAPTTASTTTPTSSPSSSSIEFESCKSVLRSLSLFEDDEQIVNSI